MFIFSNLAISVDGKIATTDRRPFPLGTPADREQMQVLRRECDAILNGASTVRTHKKLMLVRGEKTQPLHVLVSTALEGLSPQNPYFKDPSAKRLIFLAKKITGPRAKAFAKTSEIVILPQASRSRIAKFIVSELKKRGIGRLLVEGGGGVMWDFAKENLIDEYHVTVTPRILGGSRAPTLVDGEGFAPKDSLNLKLVQCRTLRDELYLIYRKTGKRGP